MEASLHDRMESSLHRLLPLFETERAAGRPLVLATVLETAGSTYRKAGAQMLIAESGEYAGLLAGGCLEGDLRDHAQRVLEDREPALVSYDMRGPDDLVFGLGAGCEGAMHIFLQRVGRESEWRPLAALAASLAARRDDALAIVVESSLAEIPRGTSLAASCTTVDRHAHPIATRLAEATRRASGSAHSTWFEATAEGVRAFIAPLILPPRILVLGGGPDAIPVVELAGILGWHVTVVDHRGAYADAARFPRAREVIESRPEALQTAVDVQAFAAAIVMSHHLVSDLGYLRQLADCELPYVGLLGPPARRERLLSDLGPAAAQLRSRLHAPIGLDIGARTPEAIALAIVAEVHAALAARDAQPLRKPARAR
jgi:xanthine/CO dehydrogenase XdhC/CoxF family maturation factor